MLYSVELGSLLFSFAGAKVRTIFESAKYFIDFFEKNFKLRNKVVKATTIADFSNSAATVNQLTTGMTQTEVDNIFTEITTCMQLEEPAEGRVAHTCDIC